MSKIETFLKAYSEILIKTILFVCVRVCVCACVNTFYYLLPKHTKQYKYYTFPTKKVVYANLVTLDSILPIACMLTDIDDPCCIDQIHLL